MIRFFACSLLVLSCAPLWAQPDAQEPLSFQDNRPLTADFAKPRVGEPKAQIEADLKAFFEELNATQTLGSRYVMGARSGFFGADEWFQNWKKFSTNQVFRLLNVTPEKIDGDNATVKVSYRLDEGQPQFETLLLKQQHFVGKIGPQAGEFAIDGHNFIRDGLWAIVLGPDEEVLKKWNSLENLGFFLAQKPGSLPAIRHSISMSLLKLVGLGALQFTQDYDEIFRFDNQHWPAALFPYIKSELVNQIPGTNEKWHFNDRLSDLSLAALNEVAQTVLFYDGAGEKLNFRWDNQSPVGFADGHVALVSREDAEKLRWTP